MAEGERQLWRPEDWQRRGGGLPPGWDFKNPDHASVFKGRLQALARIREAPEDFPALRAYYKDHIDDFINDWGVTFDPRLVERGLPGLVPFILFDKQREYVDWVLWHWRIGRPGLCEKSRDCGVTWLNVAIACSLCLFYEGVAIGLGSRKSEYVDKIGERKAILPKARMFMQYLPPEFKPGFVLERDAPYMRMHFPDTGSSIGGEGGDNIGRGDRTSIYLVDEAAHLQRAELIEESLSQTTNCRIDVSSVKGMGNVFAQKRHSGKVDVFVFDWHDDPRKGPEWYAQQEADLDPVTLAQEVDRDYHASVEGMVIPGIWVRAALDACERLGLRPTGERMLALDVADEGKDLNAVCGATGVEVDYLDEWSGRGSDIMYTVEHALGLCDEHGYKMLRYDADGLGAGVRGDARVINERRIAQGRKAIPVEAYRGSEAVFEPEKEDVKGVKNEDYFLNRKAQMWWNVRRRFQLTFRWVTQGVACSPDEIISISTKKCPNWQKLVNELSQPTYKQNGAGKMLVDKSPDGVPSPNVADALVTRFARTRGRMRISDNTVKRVLGQGPGGHVRQGRSR